MTMRVVVPSKSTLALVPVAPLTVWPYRLPKLSRQNNRIVMNVGIVLAITEPLKLNDRVLTIG